jgi:hypothetical protein
MTSFPRPPLSEYFDKNCSPLCFFSRRLLVSSATPPREIMPPLSLVSFLKQFRSSFQFSTHTVFGHHGAPFPLPCPSPSPSPDHILGHDLSPRHISERSWCRSLPGGSHRINNGVFYFAWLHLFLHVPSVLLSNSPLSVETLWEFRPWGDWGDFDSSLRDIDLRLQYLNVEPEGQGGSVCHH